MANNIVTVNVSQQLAPTPNRLQKTGAMLSQGATTLAAGTKLLLTQASDLTPVLAAAKTLASLSWATGVVTATTTVPHGWTNGDVLPAVIAGCVPTGYNGSFNITVTGSSSFTYPLVSDPGAETTLGTVLLANQAELQSMVATFFGQGSNQGVYVLELGAGTPTEGVAALSAFITANPGTFYSYLVPREWDANADFLTFLAGFEATTAKTYFFVTTTLGSYSSYTALMKCVFALIQAPAAPATEFTCAAPFWVTLNYDPGSTNQVTPLAFSYLFGVTAYPLAGNASTLATLLSNNINYVDTGAEGGISNTILRNGHLKDGNPFNYWYSIDWAQINLELALANEVINGSNNPLAPLIYNQQGINRLQDRSAQVLGNAVTYSLAIGQVVQTQLPAAEFEQNYLAGKYRGKLAINAEPFLTYTAENPSDYSIGKYAGLAAVYTPARGFEQIIFDLTATNFV